MNNTFNFPWDSYSDQPHILKRKDKKLLRKGSKFSFFKLIATNIFLFPYLFIKFYFKKKSSKSNNTINTDEFYSLCVNLDKGKEQVELVEELGVKSLQIRVFLNDIKNINSYVNFAKSFGRDKIIIINIIQSREHITNKELLKKDVKIIFEAFDGISDEFIVANAINRIKWGFVTMDEYLNFYKTIQNIRDEFYVNYKLIGSSIIDFEYHFTIRTLYNNFKISYDKIASLLYVDRRGSPYNTQMGIFDFENKIEFLHTIVKNSSKCKSEEIYITEANWPLSGTAPYAPTSEKECVDMNTYIKYMKEYHFIAKKTSKIQRIYWHQLIAPGFGLVDNRDGKIIKTKAFYAYSKMILDDKLKYFYNESIENITYKSIDKIIKKDTNINKIYFSKETLIKNKKHHKDLVLDDYNNIFDLILDASIIISVKDKYLYNINKNNQMYFLVIKKTKDNKLYITSFRKTHKKDIQSQMKKGIILKKLTR